MKKKDLIVALVEANLIERAEALEANHRLQKLLSEAYNDAAFKKAENHAIRFSMRSEIERLKGRLKTR